MIILFSKSCKQRKNKVVEEIFGKWYNLVEVTWKVNHMHRIVQKK